MIVAPRRSLGESKHKYPSVLWALVFVLALSGCGGGGGESGPPPETMRQVMLDKINEIQKAELDDVVDHILGAASSKPRDLSSESLTSTTQGSASVAVVADHDADGTLHFSAQVYYDDLNQLTRSSTRDQAVSFNRLNGIPAEGWKGVEIREESGNWNDYVDLFSDIEESKDTDYLALGFWMRERREKRDGPFNYNYSFEVFAGGNDAFKSSSLAHLTGSATYEGPATGLHMKQNAAGVPVFDYFNATASLTAEFSDSADPGTISGSITDGMTVGGVALPALTLEYAQIRESSRGGNFDGYTTGGNNDLTGMWGGKFYGNGASVIDHPGSVAGTFGASRFLLNSPVPFESFIGAFAAYKE